MERKRPEPFKPEPTKQCKFCGHYYLNPCNAQSMRVCLNVKLSDRKEQADAQRKDNVQDGKRSRNKRR